MYVIEEGIVEVRFTVTVYVDPAEDDLLAMIKESGGSFSILDVVRGEIESNLESVSYVRHVSVD
jgi:hypothetical protein